MKVIAHLTTYVLLLCFSVSARGGIVSVIPEYDWSAIDVNSPGTGRDGVFDQFFNAANDTFIRTFNGNLSETRGALEFSIDGIPAKSKVDSATLLLQTAGRTLPPSNVGRIHLHGYAGNGVPDLTDFSEDNFLASRSVQPPVGLPLLTIDVTEFVRDLHAADETYSGFNLRASQGVAYEIASSEFGFDPWIPRLEVTYSPIPEAKSVVLLLTSGSFLALVRSKRRMC